MGELIDSDPELNEGDEDQPSPRLKAVFNGNKWSGALGQLERNLNQVLDELYDGDSDDSFMDEDEHKARVKDRKAKESKLNNSFTGPYPSDPTDFNHTDKGPNA